MKEAARSISSAKHSWLYRHIRDSPGSDPFVGAICDLYTPRPCCRLRLKRDGTRAETRFRLSLKRSSPFKSEGASVQLTADSRGVRISGSNAGYTMFRGSVRVLATHSTRQFPLHFPSRASPCAIRFQTHSIPVGFMPFFSFNAACKLTALYFTYFVSFSFNVVWLASVHLFVLFVLWECGF